MSTAVKQTVEITLDTADGVQLFREHAQEVFFEAMSHEADLLAAQFAFPSKEWGDADDYVTQLHAAYDRICASVEQSPEDVTYEVAQAVQTDYNQLVHIRDDLWRLVHTPVTTVHDSASEKDPTPASTHTTPTSPVDTPVRSTVSVSTPLTIKNQNTDGTVPITVVPAARPAKVAAKPATNKQRPAKPQMPNKLPVDKAQPVRSKQVFASNKSTGSDAQRNQLAAAIAAAATPQKPAPKPRSPKPLTQPKPSSKPQKHYPSPGIIKPKKPEAPPVLFAVVQDDTLKTLIAEHPSPRQLAQQVRQRIARVDAAQSDRLSAWLGEDSMSVYEYIAPLPMRDVYRLAALPIVDLRSELAPYNIRPEAVLYWVNELTRLQAIVPASPQTRVDTVVVSAIVAELLTAQQ